MEKNVDFADLFYKLSAKNPYFLFFKIYWKCDFFVILFRLAFYVFIYRNRIKVLFFIIQNF